MTKPPTSALVTACLTLSLAVAGLAPAFYKTRDRLAQAEDNYHALLAERAQDEADRKADLIAAGVARYNGTTGLWEVIPVEEIVLAHLAPTGDLLPPEGALPEKVHHRK